MEAPVSDIRFAVHTFTYCFDGRWWDIDMHARSAEEAQARLVKLADAKYIGKVVEVIPAHLTHRERIALLWRRVFG